MTTIAPLFLTAEHAAHTGVNGRRPKARGVVEPRRWGV